MTPSRPRSLSQRLLWLTSGVVLLIEAMLFVPMLAIARQTWLAERVAAAQLAALAGPANLNRAGLDHAGTEDALRLAQAESVRLMMPGRFPIVLGSAGQMQADHVIDLANEGPVAALGEAAAALLDGRDRLLLIQSPSPIRPGTLVSVVLRERQLTAHLRRQAGTIALLGLVVAAATGAFVHAALTVLLVRPMRRLIASIARFRADPERTAPLEPDRARGEIGTAARELADMQRELRAALWRNARLAALGTAVAKVSHDLRGLLAPALLTAERLQSHADPAVQKAGGVLVRSVERASELVRGSLEFAREGPVALVRSRFALRDLVAEAIEQVVVAPGFIAANAVPKEVEVEADREQLGRVFANLIRNAREAGARRCEVAATATRFEIVITVTDDGPGLPERVRAAVFKPFVEGGRKGSTGLGLAIARDLMRAHQGDVALHYTGADGTGFRLMLPASLPIRPAARPTQPG